MGTRAPTLLPIFRSQNQLEVLAHLFVNSGRRFTISELQNATHIPQQTLSREIERLERAGIVATTRVGRAKLVEANEAAPYFSELRALLLKVAGPTHVIAEELRNVPRIARAYVFGSWAARYHGQVGPPAADIDVLVIGDADLEQVDAACRSAERRLGLEVNPVVVTDAEWTSAKTGFLRQLKGGPLVEIGETG